ncbi:MAG: hypothetical protein ACRD9L_20550 [Bryobacteraceae bacterium]
MALDSRIQAAVCEQGLLSYRTLTASDRYLHSADIFIPSVLQHLDLPQVAAASVPRRLSLIAPVDAMKRPVDAAVASRAYEWANRVYANADARDRFRIIPPERIVRAEDYLGLF